MNSAEDKPNQTVLRALPLDFSKNLEIVVVEVWLINPWPENRIKNIPIANKKILFMKEKNKLDKNNNNITKKE
tara:strand:- start:492 stop:710 length:219 start_codon:yes stop_codon:yes gene_type:complete